MKKGRAVLLIVAALVFIAIGFVIGQVVQSVVSMPGSDDDPVVVRSYVEEIVGERTASLQTEIDELKAEVATLKGEDPTTTDKNTEKNSEKDTEKTGDIIGKIEVNQDSINIREKPSTESPKVGSADKGAKLNYYEEENGWYRVILQGDKEGWIKSSLVKKVD